MSAEVLFGWFPDRNHLPAIMCDRCLQSPVRVVGHGNATDCKAIWSNFDNYTFGLRMVSLRRKNRYHPYVFTFGKTIPAVLRRPTVSATACYHLWSFPESCSLIERESGKKGTWYTSPLNRERESKRARASFVQHKRFGKKEANAWR